jgi:CubicO group peptidase (beta-lactamase class C family)
MTVLDSVPEAMTRFHVPGVAVGVLHENAEDIRTFGVTSVDNPLPVQPNTLFQIGSITKTITAMALMRLRAQGKVELEAPVRRYLPDFRLQDEDVAQRVTLRHLLTHTAGWVGDDFTDTGSGDDAVARYVANLVELPQLTPLGELWSYCNSGFVVAGRILEVVTGQTYEQAVRELVLEPLVMRHTFLSGAEVMTRRFVVGHISPFDDHGEVEVAQPWGLARSATPAGGVISCVPDLFRYARVMLGQGPAGFLSRETLELMRSPLAPAGNYADAVGTAWMLRSVDQVQLVEHSGGTHGQQTTLKIVPDRGYAQVILTNASRGNELHGWLSAVLLREQLGLDVSSPEPIDVPREALARLVGHYEAWSASIDVTADGNHLVIQVNPKGGFPVKDSPPHPTPPPVRFGLWKSDHIIALDPPLKGSRAEFVRDARGEIAYLRLSGRLAKRV